MADTPYARLPHDLVTDMVNADVRGLEAMDRRLTLLITDAMNAGEEETDFVVRLASWRSSLRGTLHLARNAAAMAALQEACGLTVTPYEPPALTPLGPLEAR